MAKRGIDSSPVIVAIESIFGSDDGYLYAANLATGEKTWEFEAGGTLVASPAVAEKKRNWKKKRTRKIASSIRGTSRTARFMLEPAAADSVEDFIEEIRRIAAEGNLKVLAPGMARRIAESEQFAPRETRPTTRLVRKRS